MEQQEKSCRIFTIFLLLIQRELFLQYLNYLLDFMFGNAWRRIYFRYISLALFLTHYGIQQYKCMRLLREISCNATRQKVYVRRTNLHVNVKISIRCQNNLPLFFFLSQLFITLMQITGECITSIYDNFTFELHIQQSRDSRQISNRNVNSVMKIQCWDSFIRLINRWYEKSKKNTQRNDLRVGWERSAFVFKKVKVAKS